MPDAARPVPWLRDTSAGKGGLHSVRFPTASTLLGFCVPDGAGDGVARWRGVRIPAFAEMTRQEAGNWRGEDGEETDDEDPQAESARVRRELLALYIRRGGVASLPDLLSDVRAQDAEVTARNQVMQMQRDERSRDNMAAVAAQKKADAAARKLQRA